MSTLNPQDLDNQGSVLTFETVQPQAGDSLETLIAKYLQVLNSTPAGIALWADGTSYDAGDTVKDANGFYWTCYAPHTASGSSNPAGGGSAQDYWVPSVKVRSTHIEDATSLGRTMLTETRAVNNILRQHCGRRLVLSAAWVTGTISGTVAVNNPALSQNTFFTRIASATAGIGRLNSFNGATTYPNAIFPGTAQVINWNLPWLLEWTSEIRTGNAGGAVRLLIGKSGNAFNAADETLTSKGLGVQWLGGSGTTQTCGIIAWDSALRTAATVGNQHNTNATPIGYQLLWLPGVGAFLYADTVLISSLTVNLPTGSGVSGDSCIQFIAKNVGTNANVVDASHGYPILTHLNPSFNA